MALLVDRPVPEAIPNQVASVVGSFGLTYMCYVYLFSLHLLRF